MASRGILDDSELMESEEHYRIVAEAASDAIITIDQTSTILFANRAIEKIFGYTPEEVLGQSLTMLMPDYLRHVHRAGVQRYVETGRRHICWEGVELPGLHKSGREVPLEVSIGEFVKDGKHIFTGIIRDVTGRKRAEEALHQSEERYRNLVEAAQDVIYTLSVDGTITSLSSAFEKITGFSPDEGIGKSFKSFIHPDDLALSMSYFHRLLQGETPPLHEFRVRSKSGEWLVSEFKSTPQMADGKVVAILGVARDVTERKRAEEALRASEERFSKAFNASPLPMSLVTFKEGRYIDVNDSFLRATDYAREDLIGRTAIEVGIWADDSDRLKVVSQLEERGAVRDLEVVFRKKTGEGIIGLFSAEMINIGSERCVLTVTNDITERKQAEKERGELLAREQASRTEAEAVRREWQTTFDAMTDGVMLVDREDRLIRANRAFYKMFRLTAEECVGRPAGDFLHGGGRFFDVDRCPICELRAEGRRSMTELPAGVISNYPVFSSIDPVVDKSGNTIAVVQVLRDQSDLYRAREEAERERTSLDAIIHQMGEGLIVFDEVGQLVRVNRQAQRIFGFSLDEMRPDRIYKVIEGRFSEEDGRVVAAEGLPAETALREQRLIDRRIWYTRPGGQRALLSITASPFFKDRNRIAGVIALVRDVTEQQREHERMQQADKLRALGQLASGVAHNFNNALAAVIGYTQLALPKIKDQDVEKYMRVVEQSAKDAARMVERIQNFSRSRPHKGDFTPVRLSDVVRDAIDITRPRWRNDAEALGIKYEVTLDWQAEEDLLVNGEPSELREVLVNIILNALDAMAVGGSITITGSVNESNVSVRVTDTGSGMTEEIKRRIFEPFFTTKGVSGLGMGLSESYRIIERHGGRIDVESQLRRGATFIITLPTVKAVEATSLLGVAVKSVFSARVLVIDDEEFVRNVLAAMLSDQGHEVVEAASAEEGLRLFEKDRFDVVFTDLAMPRIDGVAAAEEIKARHPETRIVLMSGYGADKAYERAEDSPSIDAAISKPFKLDEIHEVMKVLLKK